MGLFRAGQARVLWLQMGAGTVWLHPASSTREVSVFPRQRTAQQVRQTGGVLQYTIILRREMRQRLIVKAIRICSRKRTPTSSTWITFSVCLRSCHLPWRHGEEVAGRTRVENQHAKESRPRQSLPRVACHRRATADLKKRRPLPYGAGPRLRAIAGCDARTTKL